MIRRSFHRHSFARRRCAVALSLFCLSFGARAKAGPPELFRDVSVEPGRPDVIALHYNFGGGGLFLSSDGGQSYGLLCYAAVDRSVQRDASAVHLSGADAIFVGLFRGLWRGDADGCNWREVPELSGQWVAALGGDPREAKRSYLVTSTSGTANGIWVNDGESDAWTELGARAELFLNTLHVVKTEHGRRFYETAALAQLASDVDTGRPDDAIHYRVRVSDDDAATWAEYEFGPTDQFGEPARSASLQILTVSPTDPDVVVAAVQRDPGRDDLIVSSEQGKPGSWRKLAELSVLQAAAFGPDGRLYFGDYDQDDKGLWVSDLDGQPERLNSDWKVGCLKYDAAHARMFGCQDWKFGTVDLATGELTTVLDMRSAERFVACERGDGSSTASLCENQLLGDYCGFGHYPEAPLCAGYAQPGLGSDGGVDAGSGFGALPPLAADQGRTQAVAPSSRRVGGGGGTGGCSVGTGPTRGAASLVVAWSVFALLLWPRRLKALAGPARRKFSALCRGAAVRARRPRGAARRAGRSRGACAK